MSGRPWVEKYRPRRLSDVVNQGEAKKKLLEWIEEWERGVPNKRAVLLVGPPGTGKTTLAYALANEKGYEVLELNASDVRTGEKIKAIVGRSMREASLFGYRGRLILLDEVDGLSTREDKGGLEAIIELIREAKWPVIMTANNPWDPRFRGLRGEAEVIQLRQLSEEDVASILRKICVAEGIKCDEEALLMIAKASGGDARAAINDLQAVAEGKRVVTKDDVTVSDRAHQFDMFKIMDKVFHARRFEEARSISFLPSFDWESYFPWALDNVPLAYGKSPEAVYEAINNLSLSDVIRGRMMRRQEWELMPYMIEMMTAGVALVNNKPPLPRFIKLTFPERIRLLAKAKETRQLRDALINRLRQELHVSGREAALEYIPLLKHLANSEAFGKRVMERLVKVLYTTDNVKRALGMD